MNLYSVDLDHENELVNVVTKGNITKEVGQNIIIQARKLAQENLYNIFYDVRKLKLQGVNLFDFYYMPRENEVFTKAEAKNIKAAILVSEKNERIKDFKFYETNTSNMGFNIKIFTNKEQAELWLHEKE